MSLASKYTTKIVTSLTRFEIGRRRPDMRAAYFKLLGKVEFSEAHIEQITRAKFAGAGFDFDAFKTTPDRKPYEVAPERSAREAIALALEQIHEREDVIQSRYALSFVAARFSIT